MPNRELSYHTFMDSPTNLPGQGPIVPQQVFIAPTQFSVRQSIRFSVGGRPGVRLADAYNRRVNVDNGRIQPNLSDTAKKITMRINWPGYEPWHYIVHVFDHTYNANPITIEKLAFDIAKGFDQMKKDCSSASWTCAASGWALENYRLEDIVLVEFRHVSAGSWQPVFCISR